MFRLETARRLGRHNAGGDDAVGSDPQVWSTAKKPISAPRCLGSAAMVRRVSAVARNRMP